MLRLRRRLHPQRLRRTLGAASCVRERTRFVLNELRDEPRVASYRLRDSGLSTQVRHPLLDMWVLEEVFRFRAYDPPPQVTRQLARTRTPRVVDLGGHVGLFGLFVHGRFPGARILSFEPDPENAALLRQCIRSNVLEDRWELIEACAATRNGTVDFTRDYHLSRMGSRAEGRVQEMHRRVGRAFEFMRGTALMNAEHHRARTRDVFPFLTDADLVKIDIEGAEWELLQDSRMSDVGAAALVLEYHPVDLPDTNAAAAVRERLQRAGYVHFADQGVTDAGLLWAWRDEERRA